MSDFLPPYSPTFWDDTTTPGTVESFASSTTGITAQNVLPSSDATLVDNVTMAFSQIPKSDRELSLVFVTLVEKEAVQIRQLVDAVPRGRPFLRSDKRGEMAMYIMHYLLRHPNEQII